MALVATPLKNDTQHWEHDETDLINVFLKMWDGKTLCCVIDSRQAAITSICALEQKVLDCYPGQSRRDFFFETLSKPLKESNVPESLTNGATVFVQYRNRGGCFIISFTILMIIMMAIVGSVCTCGSSLLIVPVLLPFLFILPLFCL